MSILLWLVIINIAVFMHELAHYLAARSQGVSVRAFSLGMGPVLWQRTWNKTEWRFSLLPIGGYVDIEGMAAQVKDGRLEHPTTGFAKLSYLAKVWILAAGPLSNVILAILLVTIVFVSQGVPRGAVLSEIRPGSRAEQENLRPGDLIVSINGERIGMIDELQQNLRQDGERTFTVERKTQNQSTQGQSTQGQSTQGQSLELHFDWTPKAQSDGTRPPFGINIRQNFVQIPVPEAAVESTKLLISSIPQTVEAFARGVASAFTLSRNDEVVGPVGTVSLIGTAANEGLMPLLFLAGVLNLSLGILNLLPIPALDGGRILLASIIALRHRPLAPGQEELINFVGFAFVLTFIGLVTLSDISRLLQ